jgi:hypothetical protein
MSKYEIPFLTAAVHAFGERFAMTRQAAFNVFDKPNDQSQACLSFGVARKRLLRRNELFARA